jgi:hypothetical protein
MCIYEIHTNSDRTHILMYVSKTLADEKAGNIQRKSRNNDPYKTPHERESDILTTK